MRAALPLALLLLLAAPVVLAQVPGAPSVCGPIAIPADPISPAPVAGGETATVSVDVENGGQVAATVTVTASTSATGWTLGEPPAPASVPAGGTASFTFTLSPGADAAADAPVSFSASGTCDAGPLGTACGAACNAGSANTQVVVPLAAPEGFRFPGLGNLAFPIEYLVAAIVLIGLASAIPFLMRRGKKGGVHAECPEPLKMVKPGRGTSFPIEIKNGSKEPSTATFEVGPVPEGWSAFMPLPEVQLAAREARSLWLMVRSPATAANGETVDVELRLKDARGKENGVVRVRAEVQGSAEA